ncbi:glutamine-hydrolyzing GMP synthase [Helicobacter heilmannii]|uniref:GMP synthase [glutamine-hydrolyzing] n=1 Tax=Helicobacter heilmannii TaxID=35817 RepID=A0A0K2Y6Z0_HELHE|nr:glutamine-hydrolyzing GMP synthase [Helicobacter heilmannii]BDQ27560.1 GMP synthase [glutamine-hydrolyzing] [Helicobacter heilmannii]CCM11743.1 GMP synthase [glutamine-hydrolyzing] [Helicobacter heilmannii ASB1.4]CRI33882.1 GMP synthase [glutamine-hydrolyzing] [Helicobacter heilmannii]
MAIDILVLDFGSQYTQLVARRLREVGVYTEIYPYFTPAKDLLAKKPKGFILSGGPASVYTKDAYCCDPALFQSNLPLLGICYGMQLLVNTFGGQVKPASHQEFGKAHLEIIEKHPLLEGVENFSVVWMSHADRVESLPAEFIALAKSQNAPFCAIAHANKSIFGLQFHPEVVHSAQGMQILKNFALNICQCSPTWGMQAFATHEIAKIKAKVGADRILCAVSGGVDSSVVASLCYKAVGKQTEVVFVDHGLLRLGEKEQVVKMFKGLNIPLHVVDASDLFLERLRGVSEPEEKRKIIGWTFIEVFEKKAKELEQGGKIKYLAQGTLYPDVIESVSVKGPSKVIKSHHNVGGLPETMDFVLLEPLRELFKDEVRALGAQLGLPENMLKRHPFPGPGLAIRILGAVGYDSLELVRQADQILIQALHDAKLYDSVWQAFCVLLNVRSVGVMGDNRTYDNTLAIRAVCASDGMSAHFAPLPFDFLESVAHKIINEVKGINRVVYDITSKPPGTIEWE